MICQIRKRTEPEDIAYSLYLYFLGLSLRNTSKAVSRFVKRSHTAVRYWIQKYKPEILGCKKIRIAEFIIDETIIKVSSVACFVLFVISKMTFPMSFILIGLKDSIPFRLFFFLKI